MKNRYVPLFNFKFTHSFDTSKKTSLKTRLSCWELAVRMLLPGISAVWRSSLPYVKDIGRIDIGGKWRIAQNHYYRCDGMPDVFL
ncbi:MAG: hypothetical protein H6696_00490 [Deferribacteres bacterium]|nr:hypothetical protein [candidate division KSB1 bacterium]MCB9500383.1 hypothetical protein [Deferribacteres bacterium]